MVSDGGHLMTMHIGLIGGGNLSETQGTVILEQDQIVAIDVRNPTADTDVMARSHDRENNSSPVVSDFRSHQVIIEDFSYCNSGKWQPDV